MLFQIIKMRKMVKEGKENPGEFASSSVSDFITGILITPIIITLIVLVILFLLSFTAVFGGPFGIAKFFFFVILFGTIILFYFISKIIFFQPR